MNKDFCINVLRAGGSLRVNTMNKDFLIEMAKAAKGAGSRLEIVGSMNVDFMVEIARAGGTSVMFDLSRP